MPPKLALLRVLVLLLVLLVFELVPPKSDAASSFELLSAVITDVITVSPSLTPDLMTKKVSFDVPTSTFAVVSLPSFIICTVEVPFAVDTAVVGTKTASVTVSVIISTFTAMFGYIATSTGSKRMVTG